MEPDFVKISPEKMRCLKYEVRVQVSDVPKVGKNEFQCSDCLGIYEKGWTDEEAKQEAELAFGISTGAIVCDDCYNKIMYANATPLKESPLDH